MVIKHRIPLQGGEYVWTGSAPANFERTTLLREITAFGLKH